MNYIRLLSLLVASIVLAALALAGYTPARGEGTPTGVATPVSITELVKQLDADEFARREEASRRLTELGAAAVPELASAAQGQSLEASARAFAVLKKFATGADAALQGAARDALSRIAAQRETAEKNKNESLAAAAARASEILNQSQAPRYAGTQQIDPFAPQLIPPQIGVPFPLGRPPRMIIRGHNIGGQRVSIRVVDGTKQIDAEETQVDGQKRSVKIVSDPKSGIRMEVTTTKEGKSQTEKFAAKDAETLKKEQPEAFKIYAQYGGGPGVQINGGQIHIQGGIQIGGGGIRAVPEPMRIELDPNIEQQLRPLLEAAGEADQNAIKEIRRKLEEAQRQIHNVRPAPAPLPPPPAVPPPAVDDLFGEPEKR